MNNRSSLRITTGFVALLLAAGLFVVPAVTHAQATAAPAAAAPAATASTAPAASSTATPAQKPSEGGGLAPASWALSEFFSMVSALIDIGMFLFGKLLVAMVDLLVIVAQYNDFINASFVVTGWGVMRDLINMFFIMAMLVIAFATVLKIENYSYQKLLPRLLGVALLVNFSRLIVGIVVDFSQVIMITFVNAFKATAGATFFDTLRLSTTVQIDTGLPPGLIVKEEAGNMAGKLLGFIYIIIAIPVVGMFLFTLVYRIVALWILTILSPVAFFAWIFKGGGGGHH